MQKPSDKWIRLRRAALERARRTVIDPLQPLYAIFAAVSLIYLSGFGRFTLFPKTVGDYSWFDAVQVISTALSGLMLPVLAGSIIILGFVSRRLEKLLSECDKIRAR